MLQPVQQEKQAAGNYVPPFRRDRANKGRGESMATQGNDQDATICVTNLSNNIKQSDLQELFRPFGPISRIYMVKDKITKQFKGLAFIKFNQHDDAAKALAGDSGFDVEWAKSSGRQ